MTDNKDTQPASSGLSRAGYAFLTIGFIVVGVVIAALFVATRPKAVPKERPRETPLVEVMAPMPSRHQVKVRAMGRVAAEDEALIQAEVSGRIIWVHPRLEDGGFIAAGEEIIKIDDREYRQILKQRQAALDSARAEFRLEEGRQDIAAMEWELVGGELSASDFDRELALRKPQLQSARAAVDSARAALEQAALNLERTRIKAPWDAAVAEAQADVGDRAYPGSVLARLVAIDTVRIKASIAADHLKWLAFREQGDAEGSQVIVFLSSGISREGVLEALAPELDSTGRMAQVLVSVPDPLLKKKDGDVEGVLLLNEFVAIEIMGAWIDGVVLIPRTVLREGQNLWLLDSEDRLRVVPAEIVWSTRDEVFVKDSFQPGQRIIVSPLATPVEGMSLSVENGEPIPSAHDGVPPR